jgi:UPF0755 protein
VLVAGGALGFHVHARQSAGIRGWDGAEQFVEIPAGAGSVGIGDRLVDAGVIRDRSTYRTALWMTGQARHLKAGDYRSISRDDAVRGHRQDCARRRLRHQRDLPRRADDAEMAKIFESHKLGSAASFIKAAKDPAPIRDLDPAANDLEGYLFPETYALPRRTDAARLVRLMVAAFTRAFTPELRAAAAAANRSVRQTVTLASIVEKETAKPEERPIVAAVYANRLRIGMALQCDPTVIYALQRAGVFTGNLRRDDLSFDSPYNTYRYPGLPPGPIASPGKASLEAVVRPAGVDYVYFVSRNDGSHEFARTLEEHNRNVQKFQVQYFRDKRLREQGR